ncbi:MAG: hypothetical protein ACI81T_000575 [Bacteroidia bacterium]|jgi:hypothetical protein
MIKKLEVKELEMLEGGWDYSSWCGFGAGVGIAGLVILGAATGGIGLAVGGALYLGGGGLAMGACHHAVLA